MSYKRRVCLLKMNRYPNTEKVNILAEEVRVDTPGEALVVNLSAENTLIFVGQQSGAVVTTTFTVVP